jgi:cell division protease FtsH
MVLDDGGFLGGGGKRVEMSDKTAETIDREINDLLETCSEDAATILKEKFYLLKQLAAILLDVETLDEEDFEIIMSCHFTDKIQAGIIETHQCRNCPAADTCIHSKRKKD